MANVDIRVGKKDAVFFSANPTLILKDGQFLFNSDTLELFIGDGTSQLSALVAINVPPSSGVQSVTGPQVDNTDPNNPIVNVPSIQQVIDSDGGIVAGIIAKTFDDQNYISVNNNQVLIQSSDGVAPTIIDLQPGIINIQGANVQKNGSEIATTTDVNLKSNTASPTFTGTVTTPSIIVSSETASRVAILDGSKNIKSSSTTTTQLSYLDATSSIQTQLNSKKSIYPVLIRNTATNPADATTYYTTVFDAAMNTTASIRAFQFPDNVTILDAFNYALFQTVNGSGETVTINLRNVTDGTSTLITTFTSDFGASGTANLKANNLGISLNPAKNYSLEFVCPTWVTNPTSWIGCGSLYAY